ncbi:MAG: tRNA 2-thiouridine(34) synthase MnmA [Planctomycetota bacterium]|nr:tRNA 2-thiouridine(34) synthase MnmA [Planctomycetota bacterium]
MNPATQHPRGKKVLVAMSGGVDSSVAAALLQRMGYDVVGVFMRLGSPGESLEELTPASETCSTNHGAAPPDAPPPASTTAKPSRTVSRSLPIANEAKIGHQGCCSITDAADARLVAAQLGVPFYVCNFKRDFSRIIDYFVDEYAAGRTPNPCVRCNDWLKFGKLHEYARQIGADFVASGHYARIATNATGKRRLLRAVDHSKDQSYVLFGVPPAQLDHMLLPIGELPKPEVRELARQFNLPVFDKPDSQEICFVPDNDYAGLVERRRPELASRGSVLDMQGRVVGEHQGQHRFTIGQRRGVAVALGEPAYVISRSPADNTVTIGPRSALLVSRCLAHEANWLIEDPPQEWRSCLAKYRYNTPPVPARVRVVADNLAPVGLPGSSAPAPTPSGRTGMFEVAFDQPQSAVAPGQAIVLFDRAEPDWVLGGGWIARAD